MPTPGTTVGELSWHVEAGISRSRGNCVVRVRWRLRHLCQLDRTLCAGGWPAGDGIVVLTGGEHRLSEAARLLAEGRGRRLLISGANRQATRQDLYRKRSQHEVVRARRCRLCRARHQRQCRGDQGLGQRPPLLAADHRHLQLPHAAQPDRARARHAGNCVGPLSGGVGQLPHRALVDARCHGPTAVLRVSDSLPSAARYCAARFFGWDDSALANSAATRALGI